MAQEFIEDAYSEGLFLNERLDVYSSVQDGEAIRSLLLLRRNSNLTKREKNLYQRRYRRKQVHQKIHFVNKGILRKFLILLQFFCH